MAASRFAKVIWVLPGILLVRDRVVTVAYVNDDGMSPSFVKGDVVLIDRTNTRPTKSGSIVYARNPEALRGSNEGLIRRLEDKRRPEDRTSEIYRYKQNFWLKKDNNSDKTARDSKDFGTIPEGLILGPVICTIFPPHRLRWGALPSNLKQN